MEPTVFLFDVDGVLVMPGGYRASVRAAVNYFTRQMGLGDLAPSDDTIAIFEAQGITCEWDMVPLLLAIVLEAAAESLFAAPAWISLQSASAWLCQNPPPLQIDFAPQVRALGRYVCPGEAPSDSIFAACLDKNAAVPFPRLCGQGVLAELLHGTRRLEISHTTQVFETFALGDAVYAQATGLAAALPAEPQLSICDRPLLTPASHDHLLRESAFRGLHIAAYTARPSLPDGRPEELLAVYVPEAEMALNLIGWPDLPLVGSGQMGEAARLLGEHEERLIKPSPYHAIAAFATAWTGNRPAALAWMRQVYSHFERGANDLPLQIGTAALPASLRLHIFEDSPSGMRGGLAAVRLFESLGLPVSLHLWGVSEHAEKAASLQALGAAIYPDINQAVAAALASL